MSAVYRGNSCSNQNLLWGRYVFLFYSTKYDLLKLFSTQPIIDLIGKQYKNRHNNYRLFSIKTLKSNDIILKLEI
jgi:hypothetical protein